MLFRSLLLPLPKKVEAIINMQPPKNTKQTRRFVGMINYYRDMWQGRSDLLAPLTKLCSPKTKFKWETEQQQAFEAIKRTLAREVTLAYPDFNIPFDIHTDASDTQLGAVISQRGRPIAFYSRKLNDAQTRYTTTERELLAIVETLKEYRNILLGQQITVYTDHKNLTYKNFNTDRVMRWRLVIEEYGPTLVYIQGEKNVTADALSRLDITDQPITFTQQAELLGLEKDEQSEDIFPLRYKDIQKAQQKDKWLLNKLLKDSEYSLREVHGGGKTRSLIVKNNKIVVPKDLQKRLVEWYHVQLCHPGRDRTENTIRQNFTFNGLSQLVRDMVGKCHICQKCKKSHTKYGKLPEKKAESEPWDKLCVDLIGPYTIKRQKDKPMTLWCVTMIDPATGWFEMAELPDKYAITIANIVEQTWLTRYPWPTTMTFDKGTEFMGEFAQMIKNDYGIVTQGATVRNPQANAIIERVHQTMGNIIRTFQLHSTDLGEDQDPWKGILSATMFALRATFHSTLKATPMQLVFGRDAILNTKFEADWAYIKQQKQQKIKENNRRENAKRISHTYQINDKVLLMREEMSKYNRDPWDGPYEITQVHDNGTVTLRIGAMTDTYNIRKIKPYRE